MDQDQITLISYASGGILFSILTAVCVYLWRLGATSYAFIIAAGASALWHFAFSLHFAQHTLPTPYLLILEILRYGIWISTLLIVIEYITGQKLPNKLGGLFHCAWICALGTSIVLRLLSIPLVNSTETLAWISLILSIFTFIAVEQLYKNSRELRLIKLWSLVTGGIFGYDIYLFSNCLVLDQFDAELLQARGAINAAGALILTLGSLLLAKQASHRPRLTISRPVAFYSTSMTVAGIFLALMAIGGYYVQLYGGNWGTIIRVLVLFLAFLFIFGISVSQTLRSRLSVWVNKYFFSHKYDYREEWLRLINYLSRSPDVEDFNVQAITAVASIFKASGGALWMQHGTQFVPVATLNIPLPRGDFAEEMDSNFCRAMREHEWVYSPHASSENDLELNSTLPSWIYTIPDIWLVLPLLLERDMIGFMVLTQPNLNQDPHLTWEDLDLLKNVGRQVASYLERHNATELIAESRQFDTFNKLTAFIMHDLKNLIAQQALVVENAAKHKENPAFVEDAINTIENSVARMSTLLNKLKTNEPAELRALEVHKALMESIRKCQNHKPTPSLRLEDTDLVINADPDHFVMALVHLIKNAQEATPNSGFVDVTLRRDGNNAIITIEDNGEGMDDDFIRNQLFKPFVTTKSGKGMGIGVYQAKELIDALGGQLMVESEPGMGSVFTLSLPANHIQMHSVSPT